MENDLTKKLENDQQIVTEKKIKWILLEIHHGL